jgi:bifunctional oligoribonuclease and PAP phosphatase NrnA
MVEPVVEAIRRRLAEAHKILIISHVRPDGDAVGSVLGLGLALQEAGKHVQIVLPDGVGGMFSHLTGFDQINNKVMGDFEVIVTLDISDLSRVEGVLEGHGMPDINIDHHITNLNFAELNLVDTTAVATTEILAEYLPEFNLKVSQPVAEALLTGIISDTIGFRTSNITPKALRIAADLMEVGADLSTLYSQVLTKRSFNAIRLWGQGLSKIQKDGSLFWTTLTKDDKHAAGYNGKDDADLINTLSAIDGMKIAVIFVEHNKSSVKVSWRAQSGIDVSRVAMSFGGGGHSAAAGAEIQGTLTEVQARVLEATRAILSVVQ